MILSSVKMENSYKYSVWMVTCLLFMKNKTISKTLFFTIIAPALPNVYSLTTVNPVQLDLVILPLTQQVATDQPMKGQVIARIQDHSIQLP